MDTPAPAPQPIAKAKPCLHYGVVQYTRDGEKETSTGYCLKCGATAKRIEDGDIIEYNE